MSLNKSITHGKEHRRPYWGAKAIDRTCRNHGSCEWCKSNRTHKNDKRKLRQAQELEEYERSDAADYYRRAVLDAVEKFRLDKL